MTKRYEPAAHRVQFYKVEPGDKVGIVTVQCTEPKVGSTRVEVTYEYIALSDKGRAFVADFTANEYEAFIGEWKRLLEQFFDAEG